MEHKHTTGPWEHRNGRIFAADRENLTIAHVARAADGDYSPANGDVIAAAPELLNVAQWARDAMRQAFDEVLQMFPEGGVVPPWMATLETTIADAEHAIAKATGTQP